MTLGDPKALFMVAAELPANGRSDAVVLAEAFMVNALSTAVISERPEGVHTKYSVNKQQVNECPGRPELSNMATLFIQQLHCYNCGKLCYFIK